jgi:hypothetical protein
MKIRKEKGKETKKAPFMPMALFLSSQKSLLIYATLLQVKPNEQNSETCQLSSSRKQKGIDVLPEGVAFISALETMGPMKDEVLPTMLLPRMPNKLKRETHNVEVLLRRS